MKKVISILIIVISSTAVNAQVKISLNSDSTYQAEVACGECRFKMAGTSCDLAVRINGQTYFVDGSGIDDHGDAHASDGLCKKIRPATVTGHIENGRFLASEIKLLPENTH